ncbi:hypothetical protein K1T73_12170 [Roseovarius sp. SCSIO 43702]|uniref:hypothetical protein n=1 Tax=Roseovarius sp. SCSIO 43702 TaxID=2823043 RepID=UPI001C72E3FA|nr:hypothetical protein [Roseovarius sp. SCSIO 43702]QYX55830.1 hypothetical protein K1T73_12170 [Roseovarius sp. SCSIO 43702]
MSDRHAPGGGRPDPQGKEPMTGIELLAVACSLIWLVVSAGFFLIWGSGTGEEGGAFRFVMTMLAIFMPVAMIWIAVMSARTTRVMREESRRLQAAIDAIRKAYVAQAKQNDQRVSDESVTKKLDEIAAAQRKTETALATFSTVRQAPVPVRRVGAQVAAPAPAAEQAALPLGTTAEDMTPPLSTEDFIRALNFPENAQDKAGFDALRRALKDRPTAQLVQAAQDVLTLMSQDGIYMDDLRPDLARPELWRRFAAGERGRELAALGGIRDRSSLALTAARMKSDTIFRDAAHHFLRLFDRTMARFAETADDGEITELSNTRTARAFMLLGRASGIFD